jgi:sulfatase maturation enzyme AslB (radical SAM superfamily)
MTRELPSKTFCVLPFMHVATNASGSFRLCCNSNPNNNQIKNPQTGKPYKIYKDSIEDIWNSPDYQEFRRQFIAGEMPATCERCYREESAGIRSPRIGFNNRWWTDDVIVAEEIPVDIRYIDLRLGNLCNLKCRMCNPWASSMWVKDWNEVMPTAELVPSKIIDEEMLAFMNVMTEWPDYEKTGLNFQDVAHTVEEIYLTGGEPTLATSQYKLLDYCIANDLAKNIRLKYNTNLTNIPPKMIEYWKDFKRVQLNCSIDAIGHRDRYIRYPSNWEKVEENFDRLNGLPNVSIQIHCTVQALNVCALADLFDFASSRNLSGDQVYLNILNHPRSMNIRVLPPELKQLAHSRLADYHDWPKVIDVLKYMDAEDWYPDYWQEFVDYNLKMDSLQHGNLLDSCPEFQGYIKIENKVV